jgi:alkylated DNA nucleotide flippase Atl1
MIERLQQEGIAFTEEGQVDLENHYWDDFREG